MKIDALPLECHFFKDPPPRENKKKPKAFHLEKDKKKICTNFHQIAFMGIDSRVDTREYPQTWESRIRILYI